MTDNGKIKFSAKNLPKHHSTTNMILWNIPVQE